MMAGLEARRAYVAKRGINLQKIVASPAILNLMYVPALALFAILIFYPITQGLKWSFTNWNGYSPKYSWVGWEQYVRMFSDPKALRTVINTFIYGLGSTLFQNILGLTYALFLNGTSRGKSIVRTIVYFPVIISPLIMGYIWYFLFQYDGGAINDILILLGWEPLDWLGNGPRAVSLMTLVNTYQYMGVAMIIYLAGLQSIPKECLEAAAIDGAAGVARFRYVTLPLLMPAVTFSMVINIIGGLKLFDVIMAMTSGGPGYASHSLSTMMYDLYFARQDAGYAAALGNLMFVIITVISISTLIYLRRKEVEL
jgi:raffinose/stachyose/melibiose transport system permease protein